MDGEITSFDLAIQQSRERLRRAQQLERRQATNTAQCETLRTEIAELERLAAKEQRDVQRLQRTSLASIVAAIRGNQEDKLAREQAEAGAVVVRLQGHRQRLVQLDLHLQANGLELAGLQGAGEDYQGALDAKERAVHESGGELSAELTAIASEYGDLLAALREHEEAVAEGTEADQAAVAMLDRLEDASGMATLDLIGGGLLTDVIEHGELEGAQRLGWQVQERLDRFAAELHDLGIVVDPKAPKVDTSAFMDVFFDNMFTDLAMHDRIDQTKKAVVQLTHWLRATIEQVRSGRQRLSARCDELRHERERLLSPPA